MVQPRAPCRRPALVVPQRSGAVLATGQHALRAPAGLQAAARPTLAARRYGVAARRRTQELGARVAGVSGPHRAGLGPRRNTAPTWPTSSPFVTRWNSPLLC